MNPIGKIMDIFDTIDSYQISDVQNTVFWILAAVFVALIVFYHFKNKKIV
jgi:hypothetical protein